METCTPILTKTKTTSAVTAIQTTFNRQLRKISQLRGKVETIKEKHEQALQFYHEVVHPKEKQAGELALRFVQILLDLTQPKGAITKKERSVLNSILKDSLQDVFFFLPSQNIPDPLKELYAEFFGKSNLDEFQELALDLKDYLKKKTGVDIDTSKLDVDDTMEEMLRKLTESAIDQNQDAPPAPRKTKKQLLKEEKALELEKLQGQQLSGIYKRLAKVLHPDLEIDPEAKMEKTQLMMRLTTSYESKDLLSLLAIESEWMKGSQSLSDETLKIYNSILKDQIEELKDDIQRLSYHPRYIEIARFTQDYPEDPLVGVSMAMEDFAIIADEYRARIRDLSGKNPIADLKEILSDIGSGPKLEDMIRAAMAYFD